MTKLDDDVRLRHMLDAAEQARSFIHGRSREDLDTDPMLLLAVVKAIEIIGEAAARVTQARQVAMPQIPWPQIISMRNRLTHAYFDIDTEIVWKTVVEDLPSLIRLLENALSH
ncbi:MAG TPA: DUF86 domain-containing protein [Elainellaceae cyanobacterium]|jgi:uncharacterized protein with HEPN domain